MIENTNEWMYSGFNIASLAPHYVENRNKIKLYTMIAIVNCINLTLALTKTLIHLMSPYSNSNACPFL